MILTILTICSGTPSRLAPGASLHPSGGPRTSPSRTGRRESPLLPSPRPEMLPTSVSALATRRSACRREGVERVSGRVGASVRPKPSTAGRRGSSGGREPRRPRRCHHKATLGAKGQLRTHLADGVPLRGRHRRILRGPCIHSWANYDDGMPLIARPIGSLTDWMTV